MKKVFDLGLFLLVVITALGACKKNTADPAPANPADFKAEIVGKDVKLSWKAPQENDLKEYSLTYLPDGVPRNVSKDSTSVIVTYLEQGGNYAFTLRSRDMAGNLSTGISVEIKMESKDTSGGGGPDPDTNAKATYVGDITFSSQADLDNFDKKYHRVDGKVIITGPTVISLLPLASLDSVEGLEIYFNDTLPNLAGLNNLTYVGGTLYIRDNKKLTHINELSKLELVDKDLVFLDNKKLENLDGLSHLKTVNGTIYIGVEAWKNPPKARANGSLANFCGLKPLLAGNGLKGDYFVENNLMNPTKNDILSSCP